MAQSRGTFVGTTVGLVLASLGVLVIIAGASIWLALRTESDFAQLLRARAIRTATVDLMSGARSLTRRICDRRRNNLSSLLRLKLAELKTTVDLARNGQFASAMSTVNGDTGKDLMNQARIIFAVLLKRSDNDLKASIAAQREAIQCFGWSQLAARW